jgi:hypothetical protein
MTEFGLGTIMVVAVAMFGSLTVLPAVLSWLGDRVDKGRVPFVGRLRRDGSDSMKVLGGWNWYLPKCLEWLPHLEHGGSIEPVAPPAAPVRASQVLGTSGR